MAMQIKWRNGTAASWTSTNPVLAQGEKGVEYDTGQFKIGDGVSTWTSLSYKGATGPTQTLPFRSFGDGSDGNVTISSGVTLLTRDMYYNNLTINGTGSLNTNGCKVFVKGILDLTAAPVGAINWNGNNGGNASGATGGSVTANTGITLGDQALGAVGGTGGTGTGTSGGVAPVPLNTMGGEGSAGGRGGTGSSGSAAAGSAARSAVFNTDFRRFDTLLIAALILPQGGVGGSGSSSGSGDGTNSGAGGGAGGNGGGVVALYVNAIVTSSATPAGAIQANGGNGGNGANATAGVTGGGAGGGGGGGGWIYLAYNYRFGPTVTGLLQANGGNGGNAGNGYGAPASGGSGGNGGGSGRIYVYNVPSGSGKYSLPNQDIILVPETVGTSSFNISITGGLGGPGTPKSVDL